MCLLNVEKNAIMWNDCIQLHAEQSNGCTLRFSVANERKIGLALQQSLHCVNCQFKSGMYKLYDKVPTGGRGQKPATTNVALQIGLQDSAISNTKMYYLLTSANVPPPSCRGMQNLPTPDDLKQNREKIREINSLRTQCHEHNAAINISTDVRYNSISPKNSYGAGQSCSQAIATCIDGRQTDRGFRLSKWNTLVVEGPRFARCDQRSTGNPSHCCVPSSFFCTLGRMTCCLGGPRNR